MKFPKVLLILIFSLLFVCVYAGEKRDNFVVGTTSGYAPYVSLNLQGEYEGFDIDFARLLADRLNKNIVFKDLGSMPSLLMALKKGKIDAAIWAISITEARQKEMEMIYYQGVKETELPILFWKEVPEGIKTIADLGNLKGLPICVESGSLQDSIILQYPSIKTRYLDKVLDGILEVKYKKSLGIVVDSSLINRLQGQYPELKVLYLPLPNNQQALGNGVCISKSNKKLAIETKRVIAELREEGKIEELERKWNLTH